MQNVLFGIDVFLQQSTAYKSLQLGLVTNDAAVTANGTLNRVALLQHGFNITKLFSPEHGISRTGADGVAQYNHTDVLTQLPVISLYGNKLAPDIADFSDIDAVVFDVPDAGCRFYTYLWTLTYLMQACAEFNKSLIILDRPNPTGALIENAEGPFLDEEHCASFIGRWYMPIRHCCTLVELALYFNHNKNIKAAITVIKVAHYQRHFTGENNFTFTATSPAIKNIDTAILYPGTCLLEGICVNEGRGTAAPFTQFAAPFINKEDLLNRWQQEKIEGLLAQPVSYTPADGMYTGELCHGLQFSITNAAILKPVAAGITLLKLLLKMYPFIEERLYRTAANTTGKKHLDKLLGIPHAFEQLQSEKNINTGCSQQWQQLITPFLLY